MNKIEVLSPAGSIESLKAAINASCDAVYIGGSKFGARAYADNPGQDILLEAIDYTHIHDKKIYLTVNTLLKNNELKDELYNYIYKYYINGLDAVIVQDMGVLHFIHEHFPNLPIHGSTQMTLNMAEGANVLKDYGLTRFVPGRELGLDELRDIRSKTDLEIEVFVHGSLCYCYSGQCLMSSVFSGRSGNRGRCSQPCRLPYTLTNESLDLDDNTNGNQLIYNKANFNPSNSSYNLLSSANEKYLLSPKDISTIDLIPDLIDAGIDSFKIEGRMKRPEYTAITTYTYKKYVEKYLELGRDKYERYIYDNKQEYKQDKMNFLDIYNRGGFSNGYLNQRNGRSMITLDKPNHSGVLVGKLGKVTKSRLLIELGEDINKGDVLKIIGQDREKNNYEYTTANSVKAGSRTETNYDRRVSFEEGDLVYRVRNNMLIEGLNNDFIQENIQIKINGFVDVVVGKELKIRLEKGDIKVSIFGDIVEEAKNQPMFEEKIRKQLIKTNDTNFVFNILDINIKGKPFIPVSKLNDLRRSAIEKLEEALISKYHREAFTHKNKQDINNKLKENIISNKENIKTEEKLGIHVLVHSKDQLYEVLNHQEVSAIYIDSDISILSEINDLISDIKKADKKVYLYMPHIFRKTAYEYFYNDIKKDNSILLNNELDGYIIRNLEEYNFISDHIKATEPNKELITDYNLYIMNEESAKMWNELGVYKFTGPVELNKYELLELAGTYDNLLVYGRTPLMVTAQCLMKTVSGGDNKHLSKPRNNYCCGHNVENNTLVDRLNVKFPVVRNCRHCYNTIYNSVPLSLLGNSKEVLEIKPNNIRLDFTIENKKETNTVLNKFIQAYYYDNTNVKELDEFTRVHFNRGIE